MALSCYYTTTTTTTTAAIITLIARPFARRYCDHASLFVCSLVCYAYYDIENYKSESKFEVKTAVLKIFKPQ